VYIAVVQNNPTVGALQANAEAMLEVVARLAEAAYPPDLVVFPAYALSGMPLDGLAFSAAFGAEALDVARGVIRHAKLPCLFGTVMPRPFGWRRYVADAEAIYCADGQGGSLGFIDDDGPPFHHPPRCVKAKVNEARVAIFLDSFPEQGSEFLDSDLLIVMLSKEYAGADSLFSSSGIMNDMRLVAIESQAWVVVANLVGGQDDVVYDGGSFVLDPRGSVAAVAPVFERGVMTCNLSFDRREPTRPLSSDDDYRQALESGIDHDRLPIKPMLPDEADWKAISLATRDYVQKNGFSEVVIGISGGIDSACTAVLAVDALGADNVHGVLMPSRHTDPANMSDARELALGLGIEVIEMPIASPVAAVELASIEAIGEPGGDIALQNLQARMRMVYLMHLSNSFDWLLLNTGNKSEAAMGFSTLYGDTAGAYAPFGNVYKTDLYDLARWRNQRSPSIPEAILAKPPTAELYPGQRDTDSLPPYEVLDRILRLHIEDGMGFDEILDIIANTPGGDPIAAELVGQVLRQVARSEFKRQNEPPAPNLGGIDMAGQRGWPLTNGFTDRNRGLSEPLDTEKLMETLKSMKPPEGWGFMEN
jgi:NAD+ synthase (glutamine-hydrolysing)